MAWFLCFTPLYKDIHWAHWLIFIFQAYNLAVANMIQRWWNIIMVLLSWLFVHNVSDFEASYIIIHLIGTTFLSDRNSCPKTLWMKILQSTYITPIIILIPHIQLNFTLISTKRSYYVISRQTFSLKFSRLIPWNLSVLPPFWIMHQLIWIIAPLNRWQVFMVLKVEQTSLPNMVISTLWHSNSVLFNEFHWRFCLAHWILLINAVVCGTN